MEDKSKNKDSEADSRFSETPENLPDGNPINPAFYNADDPEFASNSTTGSGISEAERLQHDGHSPDIPANPEQSDQPDR